MQTAGGGYALLLAVVLIWVAAGELIQVVELSEEGLGPFVLTYFSASLFMLYLPVLFVRRKRWLPSCRRHQEYHLLDQSDFFEEGEDELAALVPHGQRDAVGGTHDGGSWADGEMEPRQLLKVVAVVGPAWFWANYAYNASIGLTSVASVTVLSTTSSVWTLLAGVLTGTERANARKAVAVALNLAGVVLIATADVDSTRPAKSAAEGSALEEPVHSVAGDLLALGSAIGYAFYTTSLQRMLGSSPASETASRPQQRLPRKDDAHSGVKQVDMAEIFGWIGLFDILTLWPLGLLAVSRSWEAAPWLSPPTWPMLKLIFANALFGTYLSQLLWAKAVLLTSPLVATCSLSLTIPAAIVADSVFRHAPFGWEFGLGSVTIIGGFLLLTIPKESCGHSVSV